MAFTKGTKKLGKLLAVIGILVVAYTVGTAKGWIPGKEAILQVMGKKVQLSDAAPLKNLSGSIPLLPFPSDKVVKADPQKCIRANFMGWQSQAAVGLANGGAETTEGSLMAKYGVNFKIIREDNCDNQVNNLIAFGQAYKAAGMGSANPTKGVQAVSFMLDGTPSYMAALKAGLEPYGLHPKIIYTFGKSHHEDAVWGPEDIKKNPKLLKGAIMVGVMYDGDNNIGIKLAYDNDVAVNPDPKTYDKNKLNLVPADTYLSAVDMAKAGITETRDVVENGVKTGKKIEITTDKTKGKTIGGPTVVKMIVATWTPGDVRIAKEIGGMVPIATTEDNYWQMPEAFIVIKEWADAHKNEVIAIGKAAYEAGAQVKVHDKALYKACELEAKYYFQKGSTAEEKTGKYWYDNFRKHKIETASADGKSKVEVEVGGSMNFSIEDAIIAFGLDKGDGGPAKSSYTAFGDKMAELWPAKLANYPAWDEAFDDTFVKAIVGSAQINHDLDMKPTYDKQTVSETVSSSAQRIEFASGKANVTAAGRAQLNKLYNNINVNGLYVTIIGHTDKHGSHEGNMALSKARAEAVRDYLISKGLEEKRFRPIEYYGDTQLIPGATDDQNRRVVIEFNK